MSLEQQVTALVEASNNLTSAVNGKITEIDKKVAEATASVPTAIRNNMEWSAFIDPVNGVDNENRDGGINQPFRTIKYVVDRTLNGATCYVKLMSGQHSVEGNIYMMGKTILIELAPGVESSSVSMMIYNATKEGRFTINGGSTLEISASSNVNIELEGPTTPGWKSGFLCDRGLGVLKIGDYTTGGASIETNGSKLFSSHRGIFFITVIRGSITNSSGESVELGDLGSSASTLILGAELTVLTNCTLPSSHRIAGKLLG
ncbi:hypothetical protein [Vibrio parahaemolyticus]|uniref:hypothetical protein n=1 Tax=Vibrio parahaemolyticus TaxID=670 RepID=UPI001D165CAC|nr:hypothetical protein [Vibrio parahaemolyticus]MCC3836284.1 hypothetical protein [Vibrio parahaemolyticus]